MSPSEAENINADVIVIGAGASGLSAAVEATANGAKVVLLEKQGAPAGATLLVYGMFAAESQAQDRLLINCPRD